MYRKYFFKNKGVLSRRFVASGLAAVFSAGMFGSYAGAMEQEQNIEFVFARNETSRLDAVLKENSIKDNDENAKEVFKFLINLSYFKSFLLEDAKWLFKGVDENILEDEDFSTRVFAYFLLFEFYEGKFSSIDDLYDEVEKNGFLSIFMDVEDLSKDDKTKLLKKIKNGWGEGLLKEVKEEKEEKLEEDKQTNVLKGNSIKDNDKNAKEVFKFLINLSYFKSFLLEDAKWLFKGVDENILEDEDFSTRVFAYFLLFEFYEGKFSSIDDLYDEVGKNGFLSIFMDVEDLSKDDKTKLLKKIKDGWGEGLLEEVKKENEQNNLEDINLQTKSTNELEKLKNEKNEQSDLGNINTNSLNNSNVLKSNMSGEKSFKGKGKKDEQNFKKYDKELNLSIKNEVLEKLKKGNEQNDLENDYEELNLSKKSVKEIEELLEKSEKVSLLNESIDKQELDKDKTKNKFPKTMRKVAVLETLEKEENEQNNLENIDTNLLSGSINKYNDDEKVNLAIKSEKDIEVKYRKPEQNNHELDKNIKNKKIVVSVVIILLAIIVTTITLALKGKSNTGVPNNNKDDEEVNPSIEPEKYKDDEKVNPSIEPEKDKDDEKMNPSIEPEKDKDDEKMNPSIEPEKDKDDEKVNPSIEPEKDKDDEKMYPSTDPESDDQNSQQNNQEERPSVVLSNILKATGATVTAGNVGRRNLFI